MLPIISWIIRLTQWKLSVGQEWNKVPSHVRIKFFDKKHDLWWIYEASQSSVKFHGDNQWTPLVHIVKSYEIYVDPEIKKELVHYMGTSTGKPYGRIQLVGLALVNFMKVFRRKIKNPFSDRDKTEVCAEAVYNILNKIPSFKPILTQYDPDTLDLCDIMDIMTQGGYQ